MHGAWWRWLVAGAQLACLVAGGPGARRGRRSLLLHLGVAPDMVREIVGHSDIEVTMTIYAHTVLDERRQALAKLGDALT